MSKILVVDDDADTCEVAAVALRSAGHQVDWAMNGRDALLTIFAQTPDLIVLDLRMPELDGPGLLEIMRCYLRLQSLPVIVMTAVDGGPLVERAHRSQVCAVLVKGKAVMNDLVAAVNQECL